MFNVVRRYDVMRRTNRPRLLRLKRISITLLNKHEWLPSTRQLPKLLWILRLDPRHPLELNLVKPLDATLWLISTLNGREWFGVARCV